jgi:hypothetical protein
MIGIRCLMHCRRFDQMFFSLFVSDIYPDFKIFCRYVYSPFQYCTGQAVSGYISEHLWQIMEC